MLDIVGIGTPAIDVFHIKGKTINENGGSVTTTAFIASRMGLKTGVIGYVGDDSHGRNLLKELGSAGMDTNRIRKEGKTVLHHINLNSAEREMDKAENPENYGKPYKLDSQDEDYIKNSRSVFIKLSARQFPRVIELCERNGKQLFVSLQDVPWEDRKTPAKLLDSPAIKIIFANEKEITPEILSLPGKYIIVSRGKKGCEVHFNGKTTSHMALQVDSVDTTGAGDVLAGVVISGFLKNCAMDELLKKANKIAALSTLAYGGRAYFRKNDI